MIGGAGRNTAFRQISEKTSCWFIGISFLFHFHIPSNSDLI